MENCNLQKKNKERRTDLNTSENKVNQYIISQTAYTAKIQHTNRFFNSSHLQKKSTTSGITNVSSGNKYLSFDNTSQNEEGGSPSRKRKQDGPIIVGTAASVLTSDFLGKTRKAWLFVTTVRKGTESITIQNYLKQKFENLEVTVEDLKSKSEFPESFRVGAALARIEELKESVWPEGVVVRRYREIQEYGGSFDQRQAKSDKEDIQSTQP
ncbi:hypothetical protein HHI36_012621 [Cryptolaemus montrouzieri]|uniref:Uncharacterized protein n=1 Tax=Cryptolaemus montrouzieri TaxID=559131 RepID=A0ABD2NFF3_9CUCU